MALLFVCRTSLGFHFQTAGSAADPLVAQFGLGYADIGLLIGFFMLPGLLLLVPAGWVGSRFSDRHLVFAGLLLMAVGGAVSALAPGFALLALGRWAAWLPARAACFAPSTSPRWWWNGLPAMNWPPRWAYW